MAHSQPHRLRTFALGSLSVVVLALLVSLMLFVGQGGCTSAVALDQPSTNENARAPLDLVGTPDREKSASSADAAGKRDAAVKAAAIVRGIVVDDITGELVPFVEVELKLGELLDRIVVGDDGAFASALDFPTGTLRATVRDETVPVGSFEIEHDGVRGTRDWRIAVPIGPTIRVSAIDDLPVPPETWRARIVESALAPEVVAEIVVVESGLALRAPSADLPDRTWSWRAFRAGPTPWIRYPHREHAPLPGVPPSLEVRDDTANKKGEVLFRSTIGIQDPVAVKTRAFGKARIRVERLPGATAPMRAVLFDTRDEPRMGSLTAPVFDEGEIGMSGEIEFAELEPGTKRLIAWSRDGRLDDRFVVQAGPSDVVEMRESPLAAKEAGNSTWTRVVSSKLAVAHVLATYPAAEGRMRPWMTSTSRSASNRFERVDEFRAANAEGIEIRVVGGGLPLERHDFASDQVFRFESDREVSAELVFGPVGQFFSSGGWPADRKFVLPYGLGFTWSAWAKGMQPVFGDQSDWKRSDDREVGITKVRFEPGWGAQIFLRAGDPETIARENWPWTDPRTRARSRSRDKEIDDISAAVLAAQPVPGVTLRIDGLDSAMSDAAGELRIVQYGLPVQLTLIGAGWRVTSLQKLPGDAPRYVAWLRRNP